MIARYVAVAYCAKVLGVSSRHVRRLIAAGELKAINLSLGLKRARWAIKRESLMSYLGAKERGTERT